MRRTNARWVIAVAVVVGIAGIGSAVPDWAAEANLDFWHVPGLKNQMDRDLKHNGELDQHLRSAMARLSAKQDVVDGVYSGELTLREAALRFRKLNATQPRFGQMARIYRPECSEDECQYWNVIDYAGNTGGRFPDERQFVARLTEELRTLKERGELRLAD